MDKTYLSQVMFKRLLMLPDLKEKIEMAMEGDRVQQLKRIGAKGEPSITIRKAPWNCNGLAIQFPASERNFKRISV